MNKKAVSPIIATVLLISLVVVASTMIYIWSKSFIAEQLEKFGDPIETICQKIKYDAQLNQIGSEYALLINNQGNMQIPQVNIKLYKGGSSKIKTFTPDAGFIKGGGTGEVTFTLSAFEVSSFDSIDVTPILLGKGKSSAQNKLHPCTEKTKNLEL